MTDNRYLVGSLFSGIGGFCRAFKAEGFDVAWANELDGYACATFRENYPRTRLVEKPITKLSRIQDDLEPVDVLTAGFPCQPFSVAGDKKGFNDPRGNLFFEITRLLREFGAQRPRIVLLENVPYIVRHDKGRTFARIRDELQSCGYWFFPDSYAVLNTRDHTEIPQNRERVFMVAVSKTNVSFGFSFPVRSSFDNSSTPFRLFLLSTSHWHPLAQISGPRAMTGSNSPRPVMTQMYFQHRRRDGRIQTGTFLGRVLGAFPRKRDSRLEAAIQAYRSSGAWEEGRWGPFHCLG